MLLRLTFDRWAPTVPHGPSSRCARPLFISFLAALIPATARSQLVDSLVSGRTDCVRVSRRGVPVVQITIVRNDSPSRPRLGFAKGKFRLPTWEEDKAMDREIERAFVGGAK